jgi:tetratricopeptide (TPR) repeat protein
MAGAEDDLDEAAVLQEAMDAFQDGVYNHAIALCTRLIDADDGWAQPFYFRGASRLEMGDAEAALADLSRAIDLDPEIPYFAYHDRGRALAALRCHQAALADYERAIALCPGKASTHNRMGTTLYHLGRCDEALAAYGEAIRLEPDRPDFYFDRGAVYLERGQLDEAIADFTRAIDLEPNADYYFSRAMAHRQRHDHDRALADLDAAIDRDPGQARAWYGRGYVRFLSRQREQGEGDFARAVELDPTLADWPYEERWLGEQRSRVESYLRARKLTRAGVPAQPAWELAPYLALWRIGRNKGLWVLCGDCPTDHLPATAADTPQQAVEAFGQRWARAAEDLLAGREDREMQVGPREQWASLAPLLRGRAELLLEYAEDEALW